MPLITERRQVDQHERANLCRESEEHRTRFGESWECVQRQDRAAFGESARMVNCRPRYSEPRSDQRSHLHHPGIGPGRLHTFDSGAKAVVHSTRRLYKHARGAVKRALEHLIFLIRK